MEPSPSETSSDNVEVSAEVLAELQQSLDWHAAILAVLLQEAGGVVEVKADDLTGINLAQARASISYDDERKVYIIEGLYTDES
jgi:hypothetical protein